MSWMVWPLFCTLSPRSHSHPYCWLICFPLLNCSLLFVSILFILFYWCLLKTSVNEVQKKDSVVRCINYNYYQLKAPGIKANLLGKRTVRSLPTCSWTRRKEISMICCQANPRDTTEKVAWLKSMIIFLVDNYWSRAVWTSFCLAEHD